MENQTRGAEFGNRWYRRHATKKHGGTIFFLAACVFSLQLAASCPTPGFAAAADVIPAPPARPGAGAIEIKPLTVPSEKIPEAVIPPLPERPLDVEEGPKIKVRKFILEGAQERPGAISLAELETLLESQRQKWAGEPTIGQIQMTANAVTDYYRRHGLILARAYVAEQTVKDGIVTITVLEGKLGQVLPEGNKRYTKEVLQRPFASQIGQAVIREDIEDSLMRLLDYPGLDMSGAFRPGEAVGTTDLVIKVKEERPADYVISLDNVGSRFTGEYRLRGDMIVNNLTRAADQMSLSVLGAFDPNNTLYWAGSYQRPLDFAPRYLIGMGASTNAFDVGGEFADLNYRGQSDEYNVFLERVLKRTRKQSQYCRLSFTSKTAKTWHSDELIGKDQLSIFGLEYKLDVTDKFLGGGINLINIKYYQGVGDFLGSMDAHNAPSATRTINESTGEKAGGSFSKAVAETYRVQRLNDTFSTFLRFNGQWTDKSLVSVEQFALGGPNSVRAYPQAEFLMDKGLCLSLELLANAPGFGDKYAFANRKWGEVLQLSAFIDYAQGTLINPLQVESKTEYLSGAGVGLRLRLPGSFMGYVTVAKPLGEHDAKDKRDWRTFFQLRYEY